MNIASEFHDILAPVTGGRRYCFVITQFGSSFQFSESVKALVAEATGYACIRADDLPNPGTDLRAKIHAAIGGAALVIADLSSRRPNVFYEYGYAAALNKPVIPMAREGVKIPADLAGLELIRYADTREGAAAWQAVLRQCLQARFEGKASLLHAMILPEKPDHSYIVANPKLPDQTSGFKFHPPETKTYGDNLGVAGIFGAFASYYGESFAPQLVNAVHAAPELASCDADLYLIGSPKVNDFTRQFLKKFQQRAGLPWEIDEAPDDVSSDPVCRLQGVLAGGPFTHQAGESHIDYGLLIRGPHPYFPRRMVMILAGSHSLGTGSACLAATKTELIRKIRDKLGDDGALRDRIGTLWVLVKGRAGTDQHIEPAGVEIVEAGVCKPWPVS